jgi:hypothetical protein
MLAQQRLVACLVAAEVPKRQTIPNRRRVPTHAPDVAHLATMLHTLYCNDMPKASGQPRFYYSVCKVLSVLQEVQDSKKIQADARRLLCNPL